MQPWVLELNDARLTMMDGERVLATSPGYAIARAHDILVGNTAFLQARAHPRQLISSFWAKLDSQPLPVPGAPVRTAAEYVHAHLSEIAGAAGGAADQPIILATPGHLTREQLALLLGVAEQSPLRAVGLVDAPLATAIALGMREACLHIDVGMHATTLTCLVVNDGTLSRAQIATDAALGWATAQDTWLRTISERFVAQCRFDPRRHAATEQRLYANLDAVLLSLRDAGGAAAAMTLDCEHRGARYQVCMPASAFANAVRDAQLAVLAVARRSIPRGTPIILSHLAAQVPGFAELLSLLGPVQCAPVHASAIGALAHHSDIVSAIVNDGAALPFVRTMPIGAALLQSTMRFAMPERASGNTHQTLLLVGHRLHAAHTPLAVTINAQGKLLVHNPRVLSPDDQPVATVVRSEDQLLLMPTGTVAIMVDGATVNATRPLVAGETLSVAGASNVLSVVEMVADAP